jgi:hypothetical protein
VAGVPDSRDGFRSTGPLHLVRGVARPDALSHERLNHVDWASLDTEAVSGAGDSAPEAGHADTERITPFQRVPIPAVRLFGEALFSS